MKLRPAVNSKMPMLDQLVSRTYEFNACDGVANDAPIVVNRDLWDIPACPVGPRGHLIASRLDLHSDMLPAIYLPLLNISTIC